MEIWKMPVWAGILCLALACPGCTSAPPAPAAPPAQAAPPAPTVQATLPGVAAPVTRVIDGDTIVVTLDEKQVRVRLAYVDCPEMKQSGGQEAKDFTAALCDGQTVRLLIQGRDRYRRTVAEVILPNGENLAHLLLKSGHARVDRRFSRDPALIQMEHASQPKP